MLWEGLLDYKGLPAKPVVGMPGPAASGKKDSKSRGRAQPRSHQVIIVLLYALSTSMPSTKEVVWTCIDRVYGTGGCVNPSRRCRRQTFIVCSSRGYRVAGWVAMLTVAHAR